MAGNLLAGTIDATSILIDGSPIDTLPVQINDAADTDFADDDMLTARKDSDGSLIKRSWENVKTLLWTAFGGLIAGGVDKTTPVDADTIVLSDSEASNATKKVTIENLKTAVAHVPAVATTSAAGIVEQQFSAFYNIALATSVGSSALTVSLKDAEGNDPSASSPVIIPFRNVTAATGTPSYLTITAATSIVISSGSTMGFASGVIGKLWIVGFNDGGTFRLGAVNCLSGTNIMALRDGIYSSTAEGGSGGADSAQVIYTGTTVTSKPLTILGYLETTEASAGTWATAPSLVKVLSHGDALPGQAIQYQTTVSGGYVSCPTPIPYDDTIPQNTEGTQVLTKSITPSSGANLLDIQSVTTAATPASAENVISAIFRDSTASAIASSATTTGGANYTTTAQVDTAVLAGSTSSTTFNLRIGGGTTTINFNGVASARKLGGSIASHMTIREIAA